jgi:hypothetical protein
MKVAIKILLWKRWNVDEARQGLQIDCRLRKATEFARRCQCTGRHDPRKSQPVTPAKWFLTPLLLPSSMNGILDPPGPFPCCWFGLKTRITVSMKIPFTGGCVCGAICYECSAEPIMIFKWPLPRLPAGDWRRIRRACLCPHRRFV